MPRSSKDEDLPLVELAQKGDFDAFEQLVARYERRVYALASRILNSTHDAEEVVQQTFLTLVERITSFRAESKFSTWLTKVATNHALALLRRESVRQTAPLAEDQRSDDGDLPKPQYIAQWKVTPEQLAQQRETRELLNQALAELDEKYRLVFVLRDVEGFSTEETAEALDISVSNAKVRLMRARLMLREKLTRFFGDDETRVEPGHRHGDKQA
jgi:RNA polymerase sigma-70 factor (ECF subfamily)